MAALGRGEAASHQTVQRYISVVRLYENDSSGWRIDLSELANQ
jgi:hypothetical protein